MQYPETPVGGDILCSFVGVLGAAAGFQHVRCAALHRVLAVCLLRIRDCLLLTPTLPGSPTCVPINYIPPISHKPPPHPLPSRPLQVSAFQRAIRGECAVLTEHICKCMNDLNLERCRCGSRPSARSVCLCVHARACT